MITYLIEVTICWTGFYGLYYGLLSRTTFFAANRWYLLGTLLLGLAVPLLELPVATSSEELPVVNYLHPLSEGVAQLQVTVTAAKESSGFYFYTLLSWIYWLGAALAAGRFLYGLAQITQLYRRSERRRQSGFVLALTEEAHLPFSFFHILFWSRGLLMEDDDTQTVLRHEQAHINGRHTFDVLLVEVLGIVLWCSPFVHLYRRSLRTVHEYLADHVVLQTTRRKKYGHLLLRQSQSGLQIALANHFIRSQLKKRIHMMTRKHTHRTALLRYALALPLLVLFTLLFASRDLIGQTIMEIHRTDGSIEKLRFETAEEVKRYLGEMQTDQIQSVDVRKDEGEITIALKDGTIIKVAGMPASEKTEAAPAPAVPIQVEIIHPDGRVERRTLNDKSELNGLVSPEQIERMDVFKEDPAAPRIVLTLKGDQQAAGETGEIFTQVEEMPRFPGCEDLTGDPAERQNCANKALLMFIYQNIQYPKEAREAGLAGTVVVRFVIDAEGRVTAPELVRDIGGGTGDEVLRVIRLMNEKDMRWTPGRQAGKAVSVQFNLPVKFAIETKDGLHKEGPETPATDSPVKANVTGYGAVPEPAAESRLELRNLSLSPNPTSGVLRLRFQADAAPVQIQVADPSGRILLQRRIDNFNGTFDNQLDLSRLPAGVLTLIVRQGERVFSERMVRE